MIHRPTFQQVLQCAPPAGVGVKMLGPDAKGDPTRIFGTALTLWLRPSVGVTLVGGQVDVQLDQSGHGNNVHRPATGPTVGAGINGHTTFEWNGGDIQILQNLPPFTWYPSANPNLITQHAYTAFWVYKYTGANLRSLAYDTPTVLGASPAFARSCSFGAGIDPGNAANDQAIAGFYDDPGGGGPGWIDCIGPSVPKGQPHYAIFVFSGQVGKLYVDTHAPVSLTLIAPAINDPSYTVDVGRNESVASATWQGSTGEMGTANIAASGAQVSALQAWLSGQWGI